MAREGIEIHFDEKEGYLQLGCEADAFAAYREGARQHLADFPDIPLDKVIELHVTDTEAFVARRDERGCQFFYWLIMAVVVRVVFLAVIGAVTIVRRIAF